jgi:hypothetical protein
MKDYLSDILELLIGRTRLKPILQNTFSFTKRFETIETELMKRQTIEIKCCGQILFIFLYNISKNWWKITLFSLLKLMNNNITYVLK